MEPSSELLEGGRAVKALDYEEKAAEAEAEEEAAEAEEEAASAEPHTAPWAKAEPKEEDEEEEAPAPIPDPVTEKPAPGGVYRFVSRPLPLPRRLPMVDTAGHPHSGSPRWAVWAGRRRRRPTWTTRSSFPPSTSPI